ncbi:MAG: type II toxin-antitoxin system YafQ family toxin [Synergistaceae bacterium]|nr:type II toxin-antitoxin system YafQ family toxin [Synergistaceae bacterium]
MRKILESKKFRRDRKRIDRSGKYAEAVEKRFIPAVIALANDEQLDSSYYDHALKGDMKGRRECHILFDLLLIYWYEGDDVLWLDRLNTHSEALKL